MADSPWSAVQSNPQQDDSLGSLSSLSNPDTVRALAAKGKAMIDSGAVTPKQLKAVKDKVDKFGPPPVPMPSTGGPTAVNAISMAPAAAASQGPLDMTQLNTPSALFSQVANTPQIKGASENISQRQDNNTAKKLITNSRFAEDPSLTQLKMLQAQGISIPVTGYQPVVDPETGKQTGEDRSRPIYDLNGERTVDYGSPYQQELRGIQTLDALNKMRAEANTQRSTLDLSPLLRLADAVKSNPNMKTNLAEGYAPPPSDSNNVQAGVDEATKRRADLQKALYENVKNMNGGSQINGLTQALGLQNMIGAKFGTPVNDPAQNMQDRLAGNAYQRLLTAVKADKVLGPMTTQYMNLNNAISNMANAHNLTPQQFAEAQQTIRANLGIKGSSGVDERSKTQLENAGYNVDNLLQFIQGKPANISQNDPDVRHIEELAANEKVNIRDFFQKRLAVAGGGDQWIFDDPRYQKYKDSFDPFMASAMNQITPTSQVTKAQKHNGLPSEGQLRGQAAPQAPSTGPKVGDVQKGYIYQGGDPSKPTSWKAQ